MLKGLRILVHAVCCALHTLYLHSYLFRSKPLHQCEVFPTSPTLSARMTAPFCDSTPFTPCSIMAFITLCHGLSFVHLGFSHWKVSSFTIRSASSFITLPFTFESQFALLPGSAPVRGYKEEFRSPMGSFLTPVMCNLVIMGWNKGTQLLSTTMGLFDSMARYLTSYLRSPSEHFIPNYGFGI